MGIIKGMKETFGFPYDALVLAGGRGTRLGGIEKGTLELAGKSLLAVSLEAVSRGREVVVLGRHEDLAARRMDRSVRPAPAPRRFVSLPDDATFPGPAHAIFRALQYLQNTGTPAPFTVVVACDMPAVAQGLQRLTVAASRLERTGGGREGVIGVDSSGQEQLLLGVYRHRALYDSLAKLEVERGTLVNAPLRPAIGSLDLVRVDIGRLSQDIDTPVDAARFGIEIKKRR